MSTFKRQVRIASKSTEDRPMVEAMIPHNFSEYSNV
jgi:hypothetical protein